MSQTATKTEHGQPSVPMQEAEQKEHHWLQKLVGEWTYEIAAGETGKVSTGTEHVRSLGGLWVLAEGGGEMPDGAPASTLMTLGYDPQRKRFIGTWIGSMATHLWVYDGELDAAERVLTLNSEGPSMTGDGTMARYQDMIEFKSADHRVLTARAQGADGSWQQFMTVEYRRRR